MMASSVLRLGVIGLGRAASSMLPSLRAHPAVRIVAAADPNPAARERFTADFGGDAVASGVELCARADIDAVYIATPHQCHAGDVRIAAANGKHAIVEKPMALTLAECRDMIAAARAAGTVLVVGHTHGFDPGIGAMRRLIASGEVGRVRMISSVVYTDFLYRPRRPEELDTARGGGILFNQVPHQIDLVRTLVQQPLRSVKAIAGAWDPMRKTEGALAALLEFEDGVAASLVYSGYDRFDSDEFQFWIAESGAAKAPAHGAARRALGERSPQDEADLKSRSGFSGTGLRTTTTTTHQPHFGMLLVSCEEADLRIGADALLVYDRSGVREIPLPTARAYPNKDAVIDEFYEAIVRDVAPLHDGTWGMATLEASLALLQSSRERREILLAEPRVS